MRSDFVVSLIFHIHNSDIMALQFSGGHSLPHTICLYKVKYVVYRTESGFPGTVFLGTALGFVYYPPTTKHLENSQANFLWDFLLSIIIPYMNILKYIHIWKFCFREPYDQNPVLISTLSVIKCRCTPMDLVRVETKSQVCIFWLNLGILYVQEQRNNLCYIWGSCSGEY